MKLIQKLSELKMDMSTFSKVLTDNSVRMGFEAEVYFPGEYETRQDASYINLKREIRDLYDIEKIWKIGGMNFTFSRKFNNAYTSWRHEKIMDWVEDNLDEYIGKARDQYGDDENSTWIEREARKMAEDDAPDNLNVSEDDFIKDNLEEVISIANYNASFNEGYSWEDEGKLIVKYLEHESNRYEDVANILNQYVSGKVKHDTDKTVFKNKDDWYVEPDSSLHNENDQFGVEIVSPPMTPEGFKEALDQVWKMFKEYDCNTDHTTGLHVSVSLSGKPKIDYLKLALFVDEQHVLGLFDRLSSTMAKPQLQQIANLLAHMNTTRDMLDGMEDLIELGNETIMSSGKYMGINVSKYEKFGYIEFRMMGGDYIPKLDQIYEGSMRFAACLKLAADPDALRNEYLKKLVKFFSRVVDKKLPNETDTALKAIHATGIIDQVDSTKSNAPEWATASAKIFLIKMAKNPMKSFKTFRDTKKIVDSWVDQGIIQPMEPQELVSVSSGLVGDPISVDQARTVLSRYGVLKSSK